MKKFACLRLTSENIDKEEHGFDCNFCVVIKWFLWYLQSDADYWLLSDAADISMTDMWSTERIL